jgi:hypothetical protein
MSLILILLVIVVTHILCAQEEMIGMKMTTLQLKYRASLMQLTWLLVGVHKDVCGLSRCDWHVGSGEWLQIVPIRSNNRDLVVCNAEPVIVFHACIYDAQ